MRFSLGGSLDRYHGSTEQIILDAPATSIRILVYASLVTFLWCKHSYHHTAYPAIGVAAFRNFIAKRCEIDGKCDGMFCWITYLRHNFLCWASPTTSAHYMQFIHISVRWQTVDHKQQYNQPDYKCGKAFLCRQTYRVRTTPFISCTDTLYKYVVRLAVRHSMA